MATYIAWKSMELFSLTRVRANAVLKPIISNGCLLNRQFYHNRRIMINACSMIGRLRDILLFNDVWNLALAPFTHIFSTVLFVHRWHHSWFYIRVFVPKYVIQSIYIQETCINNHKELVLIYVIFYLVMHRCVCFWSRKLMVGIFIKTAFIKRQVFCHSSCKYLSGI